MAVAVKEYELSFTKLTCSKNYVISEVKEGCYLTRELFDEVLLILEEYYGRSKPYIYISNRKYDFNVNPIDYLNCSGIDNMIGVALVTETASKMQTANFEKNFMTKKTQIFGTLKEAIDWANTFVEAQ
ncbi:MAG: hypothetical protein COC10_12805 [Sphingobium sp.]|nr:MAG: hypothetical protein COC10_12805 [Sphingobium sp.]